jgi:hypothetical protein
MMKRGVATHAGALPLPKGEGWSEGLQSLDRFDPPTPLPCGEREQAEFATIAVDHLHV